MKTRRKEKYLFSTLKSKFLRNEQRERQGDVPYGDVASPIAPSRISKVLNKYKEKKFAVKNWKRVPVLPLDEELEHVNRQLQELQEGKAGGKGEGKPGAEKFETGKAFIIRSLPERPDFCTCPEEEKPSLFRRLLPKMISKKEKKAMKKAGREVLRISRKIEKAHGQEGVQRLKGIVPEGVSKKVLKRVLQSKDELWRIEEEIARLEREVEGGREKEGKREKIISPPPARIARKPAASIPRPPAPGLLERWKAGREKRRERKRKLKEEKQREKKERIERIKKEGEEKQKEKRERKERKEKIEMIKKAEKIEKKERIKKAGEEKKIVAEPKPAKPKTPKTEAFKREIPKREIPKKDFTRLVSELEEAAAHLREGLKK